MAVAFDARSEADAPASQTSLTWSHTCTGANRVLYVAITGIPGEVEVTEVTGTYNGVAMDMFFTDTTTHASLRVRVLRLVAPATGANNIVLSWTTSGRFRCEAASFTGVDPADPDDPYEEVNGGAGGTSSTVNVASAVGDMAMDVLAITGTVTNLVAGAGQTEIHQATDDGGGAGYNSMGSSYEAGAAIVTMSWSWTEFTGYVGWTFNINAVAEAPPAGVESFGLGNRLFAWSYAR